MKNDLFKCILSNNFDDTQENVMWLVDNGYMAHNGNKYWGGYIYFKHKEFGWDGHRVTPSKHLIKSRHIYESII